MKIIKLLITIFFLLGSIFITYLIFTKNMATSKLTFSVDNPDENILMILLSSTILSCIAIFFVGVLSLFTNFVFVKLIFADEIKSAVLMYFHSKRKQNTELTKTKEKQNFFKKVYKFIIE